MRKIIWGNCIVKNEDKFLWFALTSVVDYLDKILVWDTGSSDATVEIIKLIQKQKPNKIEFKQFGIQDVKGITKLRQKMLDQSECDWVLILDGDEVWWNDSIKKVISVINKSSGDLFAIVTPVINLIGDIYHYQEEEAGQYKILGKKGHFNIRFINRKIPGLHIKNDYPLEAFYDGSNKIIQSQEQKLKFENAPLLHSTHLLRSTSQENKKLKYELGLPFPKNFKYPEVLFFERPQLVSSPWVGMSAKYKLRAFIETPLKKIKRHLVKPK